MDELETPVMEKKNRCNTFLFTKKGQLLVEK